MNELEVDVYQLDHALNKSFLGRFDLPAKYNDTFGFVVTYKGNSQVVQGNRQDGFFITIF